MNDDSDLFGFNRQGLDDRVGDPLYELHFEFETASRSKLDLKTGHVIQLKGVTSKAPTYLKNVTTRNASASEIVPGGTRLTAKGTCQA